MNEFNIGDSVRVTKDYNTYIIAGMIGKVMTNSSTGKSMGVRFPTLYPHGNNLSGVCEDGYGYYVRLDCLEKINDNNINKDTSVFNKKNNFLSSDVKEVYIHNNNVVVILEDGRKGVSKCSNGDTFDAYCGFTNAYYRAKNEHIFELKNVLNNCIKSAEKKGYKQAILRNN